LDIIVGTQLKESLLTDNSDEVVARNLTSSKRIKRPKSAWYIFDNLSSQQGEDILRQHGSNASYLVSHFHDPQSYQLIIRLE
jgi:hypothetical protein